jgi:hypothetical protein
VAVEIPQNWSKGTKPVNAKDKVEATKWKCKTVNAEVATIDGEGDAAA